MGLPERGVSNIRGIMYMASSRIIFISRAVQRVTGKRNALSGAHRAISSRPRNAVNIMRG